MLSNSRGREVYEFAASPLKACPTLGERCASSSPSEQSVQKENSKQATMLYEPANCCSQEAEERAGQRSLIKSSTTGTANQGSSRSPTTSAAGHPQNEGSDGQRATRGIRTTGQGIPPYGAGADTLAWLAEVAPGGQGNRRGGDTSKGRQFRSRYFPYDGETARRGGWKLKSLSSVILQSDSTDDLFRIVTPTQSDSVMILGLKDHVGATPPATAQAYHSNIEEGFLRFDPAPPEDRQAPTRGSPAVPVPPYADTNTRVRTVPRTDIFVLNSVFLNSVAVSPEFRCTVLPRDVRPTLHPPVSEAGERAVLRACGHGGPGEDNIRPHARPMAETEEGERKTGRGKWTASVVTDNPDHPDNRHAVDGWRNSNPYAYAGAEPDCVMLVREAWMRPGEWIWDII
ncbi:hypothetical protein F4775DRAFT_596492 [Biscogniauxia sp. FL1348]|nr:hypothetical protein F4775DRAFT_596492 [Biscogniauxia sp. FL1348]